nr:Ig-like domain-containing protein [Mycobacterium sp. 852014-52144_SCH5372336]
MTVTGTDRDRDPLSYSAPTATAKGTITDNGNGNFTYTPTEAARGAAAATGAPASAKSDSFTVTIDDGHGGEQVVTVKVAIAPSSNNAAPTGGAFTPTQTDITTGRVTGTVTADDPNGDQLKYSGSGNTGKGTYSVTSAGTLTYTPTAAARHAAAANAATTAVTQDILTVTANDGRGGIHQFQVTVDISPKNTAPVGSIGNPTTDPDTGVVTGVVTSTDAEGDTRTYSGPTTSLKGATVSVQSNGSFTYTPTAPMRQAAAQTQGPDTDTFTVTVNDGHQNGTTTVTVQVTILPSQAATNPAPINGAPLTNALVGSTGRVFQPIVTFNQQGNPSTFVRVFSQTGAVIGDTAAFAGTPSAPIVRTDGGITIVTYNQATSTATVRVINASAGMSTTSVQGQAQVVGENGRKYLLVATNVQGTPQTSLIPLTAGSPTPQAISGMPVFGPDGSAAAALITGSTPETASVEIVVINANGQSRTIAAPQLQTAASAGSLSVGPNGTVYLPTTVIDELGVNTEVLVFGPTGAVSTATIPGVTRASNVWVAANGTAYIVTGVDGVFDSYMVSVISGGGAVNSPPITTSFAVPEVLGTASDGTLYLVADDATGVNRVIVVRPSASISSVTVEDFSSFDAYMIGPDDNLYINYREDFDDVLAVITPAAGKRVLPFYSDVSSFGGFGPELVFGDDGTAYAAETTANGVVVHISSNGFASYKTSDPVDIFVDSMQVGSDGTVYLVAGDSVTAIDRNGNVIATASAGTGSVSGGVAFGDNGTAYVTMVGTDPSDGSATTTVVAITAAGATEVSTQEGSPAAPLFGGAAPGVSIGTDGTVWFSLYAIGSDGQSTTHVNAVAPVSLPTSPFQVTKDPTDTQTGVVRVRITYPPDAPPPSFTGSTSSPVGDVVVQSDGTVIFTPSAAGRQLAADANKPLFVVFTVTATDSAGNERLIPIDVTLMPNDYTPPTEPAPRRYLDFIEMSGIDKTNYDFQTYFTESNVEWKQNSQTGEWLSYSRTVTRTGNMDPALWPDDPVTGLPVQPDLYIVSTMHLDGEYGNPYVLGWRKVDFGESIYVKDDTWRPAGNAWITHDLLAFMPGTFPEHLFHTREPGEVGGYIFNNEIPEQNMEPWQLQWAEDFEPLRNYMEEQRLKSPFIQAQGTATLTALEMFGSAPAKVRGIRYVANGIELITDEQEIVNHYGGTTTPVFVFEGVEYSPAPQIGAGSD